MVIENHSLLMFIATKFHTMPEPILPITTSEKPPNTVETWRSKVGTSHRMTKKVSEGGHESLNDLIWILILINLFRSLISRSWWAVTTQQQNQPTSQLGVALALCLFFFVWRRANFLSSAVALLLYALHSGLILEVFQVLCFYSLHFTYEL